MALAERFGKARRDHVFDWIGGGCRDQAEAGLGVVFHAGSGFELRFDNDGLRAGRADQDARAESRGVGAYARFINSECVSPQRLIVAKGACEMAVTLSVAAAVCSLLSRPLAPPEDLELWPRHVPTESGPMVVPIARDGMHGVDTSNSRLSIQSRKFPNR